MKFIHVQSLPKMVALFLFVGLISTNRIVAQIVINEVVASNGSSLTDEDGDSPDWIELYNPTDSTINLNGFGISDDIDEPFKYIFPDTELASNQYSVVFASGKDRWKKGSKPVYWETIVRKGDVTNYIIPTAPVSSNWIAKNFDDNSWEEGAFGLGYGDDDDATIVPEGTISIFTRTTFTLDDASNIDSLLLHIDFDDGYVAYLNGVEISRFNLDGNSPIAYNTFATDYITDPWLVRGEELPVIILDEFEELLVTGENVLAIQIHNSGFSSSDLSLIPFLSVARSAQSEGSKGIASEINLWNTGEALIHLNFKLSSGGETIWLTSPTTNLSDKISYPELKQDESYGRGVGADTSLYIYTLPTPFVKNTTQGYTKRLDKPEVNLGGGAYPIAVEVSLSNSELSDIIYFTTDGSAPTILSEKFGESARSFSNTTVLRLRSIESENLSSDVVTHTYLIATDHKLPVVSISTHPDNLWSDESGIYVRGTNGIDGNGSNGPANWNQDWEIPIHIEYYELDGNLGFSTEAGTKIYGAWSRSINPQKSLAIYFRGEYGNSELDYKLFESKEIDKFQAFILRNSGNDFNNSHMRDALMTTLVNDTEIDLQAFQPTVVYLNGDYFGIHNMREKINEHFLASNSNANAKEVDLLGPGSNAIIYGSNEDYLDLLDKLGSSDLSNASEYEEIEALIDIDNYIDYMAAHIYYANTDWPGNNIKFWRDAGNNGKWRWIMYDTDFGFGLIESPNHNTLNFALEPNGPGWPNPSWATFIFRSLTTSDIFVDKFINRMADLMNTSFNPDYITDTIDSLVSLIEPEMTAHLERWQGYGSVEDWKSRTNGLKNFGDTRPDNMETFIVERFGVSTLGEITINTTDKEKGIVKVNRIIPKEYPWVGKYFIGVQIELTAIPKSGYEFIGWSGYRGANSMDLTIRVNAGESLTANFAPSTSQSSSVVINEVMYNSFSEQETGDWVELFNNTNSTIDLTNWVVKDDDDTHEFSFSNGTEIEAGAYIVVAADLDAFNTQYDEVTSLYGNLGFNLAGGSDEVRLYDEGGVLIDSLQYDDEAPWDSTADGTGFTLELKNPDLDNTLPENWKGSTQAKGTPGASNTATIVSNETKPNLPTEIRLSQNYPNPFNPSTNITFELPAQEKVNLSIFDMLGRRVAVLANEVKSAGVYTLSWNASQQASGVYFYRLEVGKEVFSKKMLLIK